MAKVLIEYEGNVDGLKAAVAEVAKANEQISESAKQSSAEVASEYRKVAAAGKAAFASEETKKALDSQVASVGTLKTQLEKLYDEEVQLLSSGKELTDQYKKNRDETAKVRAEFDKLLKTEQEQVQTQEKATATGKKLTTQLREMKEALSRLEDEGKTNTKEFEKIAIAAAKLEDQIGDTQERVKSLASDTFVFDAAIDSVSALAGGFAVAEGAVGLFADGNEELQQAIAKTNSAMAILNGLQQVQAFITGQSAGKLAILNVAQRAYSVAVGTSTGALKIFRLGLIATGIGAFVVALGFVVSNFDRIKEAAYNLVPGLKSVGEFIGRVIDKTKELLGLDDNTEDLGVIGRLIARQDRALQVQVKALDRQIEIQKAYGRDVTKLEIQREQIQLNVAQRRLEFIKANEQALNKSIDTEQKIFDLEQEIADRRTTIEVARIKAAKDGSDKRVNFVIDELQSIRKIVQIENKLVLNELDNGNADYEQFLKTRTKQLQATIARSTFLSIEGFNARKELIRQEAELQKINAKNTIANEVELNAEIDRIDAETQNKLKQNKQQYYNEAINLAFTYADQIGQSLNAIAQLERELTERRINNIKEVGNAEIESINKAQISEAERLRQREASELRTNRRIAQEKRKQARLDKALGIFNAVVSTAESIVKTGAQLGYPQAIPFQVIAGVIGAANVAKIASEPLPKFRKGGWINGASHEGGGVHIEAEGGEYVTRRGVASQHRMELEAMNKSKAAFMKVIEERYVRPRLMAAMMDRGDKSMNVNVNASLRSEKMEGEISALRRETRNTGKVISKALTSGLSSRYHWS